MKEFTTAAASTFPLMTTLFALLTAHRPAFGQERPFQRASGLVVGWLLTAGRHTITRLLLTLGLGQRDWTGFYRLFSVARFDYDILTRQLFRQTLPLAPADEPYVVAVDGVAIPRHSRKMPGTGWALAPMTAPFQRGLQRAQRFVDVDWLPTPSPTGYSRAVPLRWLPAFTPKAVPAPDHPPCKEWEAGLAGMRWVRDELDAAGRSAHPLLVLGDGTYDTKDLWTSLPARVSLLTRTAKNRALYALPDRSTPRGRRRKYGERAPRPDAWLTEPGGWQRTVVTVRGRSIPLTYRVAGPYVVRGAATQPLFLLVVRGVARRAHSRRREPTFWLVSARAQDGAWVLPWSAPTILAWAWQRWEVEVAHREQKTSFGVGDPQCWNGRSAVTAVQWAGWCYALLVLTGIQTWGLGPTPGAPVARWWGGSGRWSLDQLWQALRAEIWDLGEFQPVWTGSGDNWWDMADWLAAQTNAALSVGHT